MRGKLFISGLDSNGIIFTSWQTYELKPILNDEGVHSVTLVIGRVVKFHVLQDVHTPESLNTLKPIVDWTKLKPVARMGGDTYTSVVNGFDISRPGGRKG